MSGNNVAEYDLSDPEVEVQAAAVIKDLREGKVVHILSCNDVVESKARVYTEHIERHLGREIKMTLEGTTLIISAA